MKTLAKISTEGMMFVCFVLILAVSECWAAEPTLARLSFWVSPERMAEFERAYEEEILPWLQQRGLQESAQHSRATVDSVFSRLFEFASPEDLFAVQASLVGPELEVKLRELAEVFGATGEDGLLKASFQLYSMPMINSMPLRQGRSTAVGEGTRQGLWQSYSAVDGLAAPGIMGIVEDRNGHLWFNHPVFGVTRYDGEHFTTFYPPTGRDYVPQILEDRRGGWWYYTSVGDNPLAYYDGAHVAFFGTEDGLADNRVMSALEDSQGNLWFSTPKGLSRYDGAGFKIFTTADGLPTNCTGGINGMAEDREGHLWFGTLDVRVARGSGLVRYDGAVFTTFTTEDGLSSNDVSAVLVDRKGDLWIGSTAGVTRYDARSVADLGIGHRDRDAGRGFGNDLR